MHGYDLNDFKNGKAFIHFDGVINGKADYGPRICINTKGEKLFALPDRDMIVNDYEDEDVAFVMGNYSANGCYALMNNQGEFLTDFLYETIYGGSENGFWEVKRKGKHGHIDITGKEIIPCVYDDGSYFSEGLAAECLNGKWGMISPQNNVIIPFEYDDIYICRNNLITVKKNGKFGLITRENDVVVDFIYDDIDSWCNRNCIVYPAQKGEKWGIIDRSGNVIEDFIYDDAQLLSDNEDNAGEFVILLKGEQKAIYSTKKKGFISDFNYNFIGYLSDNRFLALKDDKVGFIDVNGETIIPFIYDNYTHDDFSEGRCVVYKDNKAGVLDLEGNVVIDFKYYKLNSCCEGRIMGANEEGESIILNRNGEVIVPFGKYRTYSHYSDGFIIARSKEHGNVYLDKQGKELEIML